MRSATRVRNLRELVERRQWTPQQIMAFIRGLARAGIAEPRALLDHVHRHDVLLPVEGGSANFVQVSGPQGRTQSFATTGSINTFIWNPQSLKGQLAGGDFLYAKRLKFRTVFTLENQTEGNLVPPTYEQMGQAMGQVRAYSPFLGEMVPKNLNSVPIVANHDAYFDNGFRPISRRRPQAATVAAGISIPYEYIFELAFERDYLERSIDSCPWLPLLEGGILEVDLNPTNSLRTKYGWSVIDATQTCTIDYYCDKQALIHTPIQHRLYRVTTSGPEWVLKSVGSPNGLDGVISGSRLAALSWLARGAQASGDVTAAVGDNGFYAAFGGSGGQLFGTNGLTRLDIPFRDQVSVDDVNAWLESFLSDCNPIRMLDNFNITLTDVCDVNQWPFVDEASATAAVTATQPGGTTQSLICDLLDFFPLIWPAPGEKISDMQKVNGDLSFTASQPNPTASVLNLFRSDEVCGFTPDKVMDLMDRMGLPHKDRGGSYIYVPKYAGAKKADPTTVWGFPLKIIQG